MAAGCTTKSRTVDETIEAGHYTMHIRDTKTHVAATGGHVISYYNDGINQVFSYAVPQMAATLATESTNPLIDSTTMFCFDRRKQDFLPKYVYTIIDNDTTQPLDYIPLLHALMERGILRADTTYEPLLVMEMYDSAKYIKNRRLIRQDDSLRRAAGEIVTEGYYNVISVVGELQKWYRMPVAVGHGLDADTRLEVHYADNNWQSDSLWLDNKGLRVVPDPQGRQMRIIEFNRVKGGI